MRIRALVALLTKEIFGLPVALPELPPTKSIRGIGMSDSPELAAHLAAKFDYTNTFYHQAPYFDAVHPDPRDHGRFDFIFSTEVMEHVAPPVEEAFASLLRLLKPEGLLLLTTPYNLEGETAEHFPDLHEYALASPGGRVVLVNRRRDGQIEVFEDLVFHGGDGSTLEMRAFTQESLRQVVLGAGFSSVCLSVEDFPEFGVRHAETWSLPIVARKGAFKAFPEELAREYRDLYRKARNLKRDLETTRGDYERYIEFHETSSRELQADLTARTHWARKMESDLEERTEWSIQLQRESQDAIEKFEQAHKAEQEAWQATAEAEKKLAEARTRLAQIEAKLWTRLGRKLGTVK